MDGFITPRVIKPEGPLNPLLYASSKELRMLEANVTDLIVFVGID